MLNETQIREKLAIIRDGLRFERDQTRIIILSAQEQVLMQILGETR